MADQHHNLLTVPPTADRRDPFNGDLEIGPLRGGGRELATHGCAGLTLRLHWLDLLQPLKNSDLEPQVPGTVHIRPAGGLATSMTPDCLTISVREPRRPKQAPCNAVPTDPLRNFRVPSRGIERDFVLSRAACVFGPSAPFTNGVHKSLRLRTSSQRRPAFALGPSRAGRTRPGGGRPTADSRCCTKRLPPPEAAR